MPVTALYVKLRAAAAAASSCRRAVVRAAAGTAIPPGIACSRPGVWRLAHTGGMLLAEELLLLGLDPVQGTVVNNALRRRAHGALLRADWVPVAEHQGRRILYGTGTDG